MRYPPAHRLQGVRPAASALSSVVGEEEDVDIAKMIADMTDEQAYQLLAKAQRYMAALPEPYGRALGQGYLCWAGGRHSPREGHEAG